MSVYELSAKQEADEASTPGKLHIHQTEACVVYENPNRISFHQKERQNGAANELCDDECGTSKSLTKQKSMCYYHEAVSLSGGHDDQGFVSAV